MITVRKRYENEGFHYTGTGGGCDAFCAEDPHWTPTRTVTVEVTRDARPGDTPSVRVERGQGDTLDLSLREVRELSRALDRLLGGWSHRTGDELAELPPCVYVTAADDVNVPGTLREAVSVGYYDSEGQQVWYATLPSSAKWFMAWGSYAARGDRTLHALLEERGYEVHFLDEAVQPLS